MKFDTIYLSKINGLYDCDIDKNTSCAKTNCVRYGGPCSKTSNKDFAKELKNEDKDN